LTILLDRLFCRTLIRHTKAVNFVQQRETSVERQIEESAACIAAAQCVLLDTLGVILVPRLPVRTTSLLQVILAARTIDSGRIPSLCPL
jgi:hypothetical protein